MRRYILLLLLPILAFVLVPMQLHANIGKITVLRGDVTITRDVKEIKARAGTALEKEDFIKTAANAKVQIIFNDKTIFTIGKNSTLNIAEYLYDEAKPSNNKAKFNILKGAFTSITGRIGKLNKSKFKLKTKSASIGIRGTIIKANQEIIMCTGGAITVTTPNGMSVVVEAGSKTSVASGTPSAPQAIQPGDEAKIGADITEEDKKESEAQAIKVTEDSTEEPTIEKETTEEEEEEQSTIQDEKNSDTTTEEIEKYSDGTLSTQTGYTMKDGTSSSDFTVTINTDSDTATTSNGDNLKVKDADSTMSWGYWDDGSGGVDYKKVWVSGRETSVGILNSIRDPNAPTTIHNYTGQSIGTVKNNGDETFDNIKVDADNAVNMRFDLGGGTDNFSGSIKFKTDTGTRWDSSWTSGEQTSGTSFETNAVGGQVFDSNDDLEGAITSGNVKGSFYGTNAESVGGTFKLNSGTKTAIGVIKATE
ncbi:MAG: FecR domain-containing protein [Arcobacteraceae bacterium]|nr:FecR domain-containing protein [Arcobacteraceae bacterium]